MLHRLALAVALLSLLATSATPAERTRSLLKLDFEGQSLEGTPLSWGSNNVVLLDRAGALWNVDPQRASNVQKTTAAFTSYTQSAMQARLRQEFGKGYEVTATGHYLVVHPAGLGERWSRRFEELYRSFVHYFAVRSFQIDEPEFPLVAVVLRNQAEFRRYSERLGEKVPLGLLGYYSSQSNRIALYDIGNGSDDEAAWATNAATIIHEATHQTAFNTGIHSRFTPPPRFVAEGLGMLFEAPGVWNSRANLSPATRINRGRLADFRRHVQDDERPEALFAELIASDRLFSTNVDLAYAEAWAFSYYLLETQPARYGQYLKLTARRPDFTVYTGEQRLADFASVFGRNFKLLDAQFMAYLERVK
jgi:hypothetical protein